MNKVDFIAHLRATVATLKPLTQIIWPGSGGSAAWNGTEYVKGRSLTAIPIAAVWSSTLQVIADLLEAQDSEINAKQAAVLDRMLFGGMGSLNDLNFDEKALGPNARTVNQRLDDARAALFASFHG